MKKICIWGRGRSEPLRKLCPRGHWEAPAPFELKNKTAPVRPKRNAHHGSSSDAHHQSLLFQARKLGLGERCRRVVSQRDENVPAGCSSGIRTLKLWRKSPALARSPGPCAALAVWCCWSTLWCPKNLSVPAWALLLSQPQHQDLLPQQRVTMGPGLARAFSSCDAKVCCFVFFYYFILS